MSDALVRLSIRNIRSLQKLTLAWLLQSKAFIELYGEYRKSECQGKLTREEFSC